MDVRRPALLDALNTLYGKHAEHPAHALPSVSLVGAGPGDPDLLTRAAVSRLQAADLVLYDALVDERVLAFAPGAQRFFVGKRAGRHALSQHEIQTVMIRAARRGRRVVRLKGGDPFVFGRGGEEALALRAAGVSFDVVPGVSSAVAAAGLAGIPVTHRGISTAFAVVSGHDEDTFAAILDGVAPGKVTLVILMGLGRRAALAGRLIDAKWNVRTPAAIVAGASTPDQFVWRGTLEDVAADRATVSGDAPAVIVVGKVAALDLTVATSSSATRSGSSRVASTDQFGWSPAGTDESRRPTRKR
jgi:uroporphyrin-III C-methyltransferase